MERTTARRVVRTACIVLVVVACAGGLDPVMLGASGREPDPGASAGAALVDDFAGPLDRSRWRGREHWLGRGPVHPDNVRAGRGALSLVLPAGTWEGGEIRSRDRHGYGFYEVELRTPAADGSVSAFFLSEGARDGNDEIDIEILNGTREVLFTTWRGGRQTNDARHVLDFDPSAGFHRYGFAFAPRRVTFYVDGKAVETFTQGVPQATMFVTANAWWPVWLSGARPDADLALEIDRIAVR